MTETGKKFLEEDYLSIGSNERTLIAEITDISSRTIIRNVDPTRITIYSIVHIGKEGLSVMVIQPDYMDVEELFPLKGEKTYFSKENNHYVFFSYERFKTQMGVSEGLIEEIKEAGYFLRYSRKMGDSILLVPSKTFYSSLYRQLECAKLPDIEDPFLHIFLAYLLRDAEPFKMVYRAGDQIGKVFACFSPNYAELPQKDAVELFIKEMKKEVEGKVSFYKITHFATIVRFEISLLQVSLGRKRVVGCVLFSLSDTGDISFTLQACISVNGRDIKIGESVSRPHKGTIDIAGLVRMFMDTGYKELVQIIENLRNIQRKKVSKPQTIKELLAILNFEKIAGTKVAKHYLKRLNEMEEITVELSECVVELLNLPGMLEDFYRKATYAAIIKRNDERRRGLRKGQYEEAAGKNLPDCVLEKLEPAIGSLFVNSKAGRILYGNKQN